MAYEFETRQRDGYILITASGSIESLSDFTRIIRLMQESSGQFLCRRFLVDERAVVKTIDPYEITVFAESISDSPERMRVAIVYSPENVARLRWMETIFQNRSLAYRQFPSIDEAEQWLMSSDVCKY